MKFILVLTFALISSSSLFICSSKADITFNTIQKYSKADTAKYQKSCKSETKKLSLQSPDPDGNVHVSSTFFYDCYQALESRQNGKGKVSQCISDFRAYARFYDLNPRNQSQPKKALLDCVKVYR
jgi:hypothetical protein